MVDIPRREAKSVFHQNWQFFSWETIAHNYGLIAYCLNYKGFSTTCRIIDQVNDSLPGDYSHVFDGTTNCLSYLVNHNILDIEEIPDADIRSILNDFFKDPYILRDAPVSERGDSYNASVCKRVVIQIYLQRKKLHIFNSCPNTIKAINALPEVLTGHRDEWTDEINVLWLSISSVEPWNLDGLMNISGFMSLQTCESFRSGSDLNRILDIIQPSIDKMARDYIPDYHAKHPARFAIRHASIPVFYNSINNLPADSEPEKSLEFDDLEYFAHNVAWFIFSSDMKLQPWFIEYLNNEMPIRLKLIEATSNKDPEFKGEEMLRYFYFPVFEYFRFVRPNTLHKLNDYLCVFDKESKTFCIEEKDYVAKHIVFSIQAAVIDLISQDKHKDDISKWEQKQVEPIKDALDIFLLKVIEPLRKKVFAETRYFKKFHAHDLNDPYGDIIHTIEAESLESLLLYDESKCGNLFGYLKSDILNRTRSMLRPKKAEKSSLPLGGKVNLVKGGDLRRDLEKQRRKDIIQKALTCLTPKQRKAIEKAYYHNKTLTDAERQLLKRAKGRLKDEFGDELRELL